MRTSSFTMGQAKSRQLPYPLTQEWEEAIEVDLREDASHFMDNDHDFYDPHDHDEEGYYEGYYAEEEYFYPEPEPSYEPAPQTAPTASINPALVAMIGVLTVVVMLVGLAINIQRNPGAGNNRLPSFGRNAQIPVTDFSEAEQIVWEGGGSIAPLFTKEVQHWGADIDRWSAQYSIDPNMVATIMQIESCGHPGVASIAGAQGLFQVMPFHFTRGEVMTDPDTNAKRGINYLKERLAQTGNNWRMAAAGYNGGHVASASEYNWVAETQSYVVWAEGIYADALAGSTTSSTLDRWLTAGGQSLCDKAALAIANR